MKGKEKIFHNSFSQTPLRKQTQTYKKQTNKKLPNSGQFCVYVRIYFIKEKESSRTRKFLLVFLPQLF